MHIETLLELIVLLVLGGGVLYLIFDVKNILWKLLQLVAVTAFTVGVGVLIGIGVHLANVIFGW